MLDLTATTSSSLTSLTKMNVSRDGKARETLVYDITLTFKLEDEDDAQVADRALPGAMAYYESFRGSEARGGLHVAPPEMSGRLRLKHEDGVCVLDTDVDVLRVDVKKGAKEVASNVKVRASGLRAATAGQLAEHLGKRLTVEWEVTDQQMTLAFPGAADSGAVVIVAAEWSVDGETRYAHGRQVALDDDEVVLDDFGQERTVVEDDVITRLVLSPPADAPEGTTALSLIEAAADRAREAGGEPTYAHLVLAIAAVSSPPDGETHRLTQADLDAFVANASETA